MASSSIVSPRVPIQAIKKLDTFNDNCYYPIQAISFLATFAMYEFEELPPQSIVSANRTMMHDDVKALADAEILDSCLTPRFQQIVAQYHRLVEKCVIFRNTVGNLYGALPKKRKDSVLAPQDPPHPSLYAVSYLCIYGVTAGAAPKPTDKTVDCTAIKMLEDMTKIAAEAGSCRPMRDQYSELQNFFDDILSLAVDFKNQIEEMREDVPSLI